MYKTGGFPLAEYKFMIIQGFRFVFECFWLRKKDLEINVI